MFAAPLLAALLASASQTDRAPVPAPLPVHIGGRVREEGDGSRSFGWPGTYFEGRFNGTAVEVRVESGTEFMRLLVDGQEKLLLQAPGEARLAIAGLPPGDHVVRLEKQTESQTGGGRFIGFFPLSGSRALPVGARERQIEFIGDSYTVGYGNTSPGRTCTPQEVHDLTDTQRAFGPLLANGLGADYRVHAYSGFGIVRNYGGSSPGQSLPSIYPRLLPGDPAHIEKSRGEWRPQLIVVNLGTNDFSTPLKPGENWRSQDELRRDYRARYIAFGRELMRRQPQARMLLMGSDGFIEEVKQVAAALDGAGGGKVTALRFGDLDLSGCNFHPSARDHQALAALLKGAIERLPPLRDR